MSHLRTAAALAAVLVCTSLGAAPATAAPALATPTATADQSTLVALRAAHHSGFDRLVLQFSGSRAPSASVKYVNRLVHDGSGHVVAVPGRATLRIVVRDARAHDGSGNSTVRLSRTFGLPVLRATRAAGDFEGVVTLGVGLTRKAAFQVTRLRKPARLVIDVSTRAVLPASSCVYLVKGLEHHGGMYAGSFLVGQLAGGQFTGSTGAFYSEWVSVRGAATASRTALQIDAGSGTWRDWPQQWRPSRRTFTGWLPVTRATMRMYSGGGVPVPGTPCA